ncbi:MAG: hypothetical protein MJD61_21645 [Proteobacteria bacterium]|nr:hypothetical protein [Pseudomonadota bacterium]
MYDDAHATTEGPARTQASNLEDFRGRWVVIDEERGCVMDADEDLGALCGRMVDSQWTHCCVVLASAGDLGSGSSLLHH